MEATLRATMDELVAGQGRYIDLIESLPNGIVATDEKGIIALVNARTETMFGYRRSELIGRPMSILLSDGGAPAAAEPRGKRKDGTEFPLEIDDSLTHTGRGELVTSVLTDITERKKLEAQLHQAQKMEAIGRLAGGVAHDFNNLLQVIGGYAQSLHRASADSKEAEMLAEIGTATSRGAALTRQLLAFSRRQVLEPTIVDLNRIVTDMERMLGRMIGEDIALSIDLEPELDCVLADQAQIEQVVANLVVNARDAMPQGGHLSISTRNVELRTAAEALDLARGPYVRLAVTDSGFGMDATTVARALEPFFSTKDESHGTGLGLAMVDGIVAQSGGGVRIISEPGVGTTIAINLPRADGAATAVDPLRTLEAPGRGGTERILLVEDEPAVRRLLAEMLSEIGYRVTAADCAASALECFADGEFDLLITDFIMPGMTGRQLVDALAEAGKSPLALFVSGYAPEGSIEEAHGREGYLQKPFGSEELAERVRGLLDLPEIVAA
jgi:hypothetical protein